MKVCTDACIFGASVSEFITDNPLSNASCLDIGAGTGLLSLMIAQRCNIVIDAVEIDDAAYLQAKENFDHSPWKERLHIFCEDARVYAPQKKYDYIISNPPFFENDLRTADEKKNAARHDTTLTLQQLLKVVADHLNDDGFFAVLLPFQRSSYFEEAAFANGLSLVKKILVKQTPTRDHFRNIVFFSRKRSETIVEELVIKNEGGEYTQPFIALLKDYYLKL